MKLTTLLCLLLLSATAGAQRQKIDQNCPTLMVNKGSREGESKW
jgi:hypothetical protein